MGGNRPDPGPGGRDRLALGRLHVSGLERRTHPAGPGSEARRGLVLLGRRHRPEEKPDLAQLRPGAAGLQRRGLCDGLRCAAPSRRAAAEPPGFRGRVAALGLQHRRQLRDQHQLAELWWRDHDVDAQPDAGADRAELRFGRHRRHHRRRSCQSVRRQSRRGPRQFLGRPGAHHPLCAAAAVHRAVDRTGRPGPAPDPGR